MRRELAALRRGIRHRERIASEFTLGELHHRATFARDSTPSATRVAATAHQPARGRARRREGAAWHHHVSGQLKTGAAIERHGDELATARHAGAEGATRRRQVLGTPHAKRRPAARLTLVQRRVFVTTQAPAARVGGRGVVASTRRHRRAGALVAREDGARARIGEGSQPNSGGPPSGSHEPMDDQPVESQR